MRGQLRQGIKSSGKMTSGCKEEISLLRRVIHKRFAQRPCDRQRVVKTSIFHLKEFLVLILTTVLSANRRSVLIMRVSCT